MDWKKSKYKKTIGISEKNLAWIDRNKKKKSKAGYLDMIIDKFKHYKLNEK